MKLFIADLCNWYIFPADAEPDLLVQIVQELQGKDLTYRHPTDCKFLPPVIFDNIMKTLWYYLI